MQLVKRQFYTSSNLEKVRDVSMIAIILECERHSALDNIYLCLHQPSHDRTGGRHIWWLSMQTLSYFAVASLLICLNSCYNDPDDWFQCRNCRV